MGWSYLGALVLVVGCSAVVMVGRSVAVQHTPTFCAACVWGSGGKRGQGHLACGLNGRGGRPQWVDAHGTSEGGARLVAGPWARQRQPVSPSLSASETCKTGSRRRGRFYAAAARIDHVLLFRTYEKRSIDRTSGHTAGLEQKGILLIAETLGDAEIDSKAPPMLGWKKRGRRSEPVCAPMHWIHGCDRDRSTDHERM